MTKDIRRLLVDSTGEHFQLTTEPRVQLPYSRCRQYLDLTLVLHT